MFSIGAFLNGVPWIVQISNFSVPAPFEIGPIENEFNTRARKVLDGGAVVPWPFLLLDADVALLSRVCAKRPRKPKEFSDLLGAVNLRAAQSSKSGGTVSPNCVTTYMPPAGDGMQTHVHNPVAGAPPFIKPTLLFGIDLTEMMQVFQRGLGEKIASEDTERAGKESVIRRNLLKKGSKR